MSPARNLTGIIPNTCGWMAFTQAVLAANGLFSGIFCGVGGGRERRREGEWGRDVGGQITTRTYKRTRGDTSVRACRRLSDRRFSSEVVVETETRGQWTMKEGRGWGGLGGGGGGRGCDMVKGNAIPNASL